MLQIRDKYSKIIKVRIKKLHTDIKGRFWIYFISVLMLVSGIYAAKRAGIFVEKFKYQCPLNDTLHNILPLVNANILTSLFPVIFSILVFTYIIFFVHDDLPYILFLIGLYNSVRALFLILTQLPPPYPRIDDYPYFFFPGWYFGTRDLFPSGHTGFSFLIFLLIKDNKFFKWLSLFFAISIAIGLLLMRVHYSIDIFGAIFIVYAIYSFSEKYIHKFFRKMN